MKTKRIIAFLLTLIMILGVMPVSSFANDDYAGNEIIASVAIESDYSGKGYKVSISDKTITLKVPSSDAGKSIDPNAILAFKYETGVVNPVVSYSKSTVKVDEDAATNVTLTILYGKNLNSYSDYKVSIVVDETIVSDADLAVLADSTGKAVTATLINKIFKSYDDVEYISILGAPKAVKFVLSGSYVDTNASGSSAVLIESAKFDKLYAVPLVAKGTQTFAITAYDEDEDKLGTEVFTVEVVATEKKSDTLAELSYTVEPGKSFTLVTNDINTKFKAVTGENFAYATFTLPATLYGSLQYDEKAISTTDEFVRMASSSISSEKLLSKLVFVPSATYTGTLTLNYTAYNEDEDVSCTGKINITYKKTVKVTFTDVKSTDYFYETVSWAVNNGITTGTTATTFSPKTICTRAQILTFMWRSAGSPSSTITNKFTDVKSSAYYYKAVLWAAEKGIIDMPVTSGKLNPDATISRSDVVTYLYKMAGSPSVTKSNTFTDVPSTAPYASAVAWAVGKGITTGTSATKFTPAQKCDRAQIVTFLYRYYEE
ncbi:MAG: S-layer homology domain-containing protein [Bacillota bacterium]|nr:S-layer homology domain-containing protein [Bacillota bacterium]